MKREPGVKGDESATLGPKERLKKWMPQIPDAVIDQLVSFRGEILKFNKTLNLISPNTEASIESVHIADSVLASQIIAPHLLSDAPVYDFGSGNGCPGIVFAVLNPALQVFLVDSDQRKMEFCKHVAFHLGLKNLSTEIKRVEDLPASSIKNVISRGFAPLNKGLLLARKPVAKGGRFFHLKGEGWANELAQLPSLVFTYWAPNLLGKYKLPDSTTELFVILTEKVAD